jgi:hypothetical protein
VTPTLPAHRLLLRPTSASADVSTRSTGADIAYAQNLGLISSVGIFNLRREGTGMFAQVAKFTPKQDRWSAVESEINTFRSQVKSKGISIKEELILRNHDSKTWMVIALFDKLSDLDEVSQHPDAQKLLQNVKTHVDGEIELFEAEVF